MSSRSIITEVVEGVLWIVDLVRTSLSAEDKSVDAAIGGEDPGSPIVDGIQVFGQAGFKSRPKDGGTGGAAKAIRVMIGGESIIIGTHDPRVQIEVAEGETLVHALGEEGTRTATLRLRPDGTVVIDGDKIELGEGASKAIARELDPVEVTVPAGTFVIAVAGPGVSTVTMNTPITLDGEITQGSSVAKAVD